ncbi:MAG: Ig-like domain-containing protein [Bacteroidota bacterium]
MKLLTHLLITIFITSCVGTDFIDDRTPSISIEPSLDSILLIEGETIEIEAKFIDREGVERKTELLWNTGDPSIASVPQTGKTITGVSEGRTTLSIGPTNFTDFDPEEVTNREIEVVVIKDPVIATLVSITTENGGIVIENQKQLSAVAINARDEVIENPVFTWESDNENVLSVDSTGLLTANSIGSANVTASKDGISSSNLVVNVVASDTAVSDIELTIEAQLQRLGASGTIEASAFNTLEEELSDITDFSFSSSNSNIVSIEDNGDFVALGVGSVIIQAFFDGIQSQELEIEVKDPNIPTQLEITTPSSTVLLNESLQLSVEALNAFDETISTTIAWSSSNSEIAMVSITGLVSGVASGISTITATADNGLSSAIAIMVMGSNARAGTFTGTGGYSASGSAMLVLRDDEIFLEISSDFRVSNGPGIFWFLSNTTNGRTTLTQGLQISEGAVRNGAATFNISQVDSNVTLDEYDFIVVLCVPFGGLTFGFAEFDQ